MPELTEFDRLCIYHACAENMRGTEKFCPMADEIRAETGSYPHLKICRKAWNRAHGAEPEEKEVIENGE